ncbi:MAG: TraR/DksA family transcriptional regulator [Chitinophagaceae bacterium]|nr:MAG: TraR/DksA family transcriptional regulator [Chitinophagaceae bacterium]
MAIKKKQAPKKAAKPAPKAAPKKAVATKTVKKTTPAKPAPKSASKPSPKAVKVTPAKKAAVKPAPKPAPKPAAKAVPAKPTKPEPVKKTIPAAKPAPAKVEAKPAPAPVPAPAPPPPVKVAAKKGGFDPQSLVTIKPTAKPVVKKEPPKPMKVVIPKTTAKGNVKYEPEFTKSVLDTPMQEYTGPTMRYSDADLTEFREIINKKLDAAKKELAYLQGLITRRDEGGDVDEARYMTMEDGSVSMEREQLSQMASRQITFIDHLEKALMRIESKTYGVCRVTGKLIDKARLRAVPHATLSIEAKQMMNK